MEILEFLWPPLADADGQRACVCYVLMLRTDGFLLCVPGPFFSASELAPDGDDGAVRPGPSFQLTAPAVALSEEGEWILAPSTNPIAVTVVDFAASALGEGAGASTDYQTGVSDPGGPQAEVRRQRPKRPTVALLAQQQASLTEVVARLSDQLAKFQQAPSAVQPPRADPTPQPALSSAEARRAPLTSHLGVFAAPTEEAPVLERPGRPGEGVHGAKCLFFPVCSQVFGSCSGPSASSSSFVACTRAGGCGSRCSAGGRYYRRRAARRARAARPDVGYDGSEPGPVDFGGPPSSGGRPSAGQSRHRCHVFPRVPDQTAIAGRARLSLGGFCREGEGEGSSQHVPRGGGLHRAFLAMPLLRAVWRVRKTQRVSPGGVASRHLLRLDDGGQQQRRSRCVGTFGCVSGSAGARPRGDHCGMALDSAARPPTSALQCPRAGSRNWCPALFPLGGPKVDHLGFGVPPRDGPDRQPPCRSKAKTKTAPGPASSPDGPHLDSGGRRLDEEAAESSPVGSKEGHGRCPPSEVAPEGLDACDLSFDGEFTFTSWAASLTRLVLKSGTGFAHFLASSLHLFRSDVPSAPTALYPIPSPSALPVGRRARKRGGTRRANLHMSRALHVIILALNFVHAGLKPVPLDLLRRSPNSLHVSVYRRVSGYLRACCRRGVSMPFCAGRRGTHLAARFGELTDFLLACGVGPDAYDGAVHEAVLRRPLVPHAPGGPDCLRPYRPLEADGIVLHGEANWDISPYLPPGMLLAYRDPLVLETFPGTGGPSPSFQHEDPGEVLKLMKVWDSKGLLSLRPGGLSDIRCSRVFGAYKGPSKFRQIGDRRGPNSLEARLDGVSHLLPQGFLLTRLHVPRFTHQLLGSSTDRKDFYSQCKVPLERAFSNAVKPGFSLGDFANTRAHRAYVDWVLSEAGKEHCRRYLPPGDFSSVAVRRSALLCPSVPVHGCFNSLFQGDAAGVELATAAHAAFLEEARVLPSWEGGRVLAKHPVHPTGPWSGVVIDDLFCISCEPADLPDHLACDSARVIGLSKEAYARAGVRGSDDKDV